MCEISSVRGITRELEQPEKEKYENKYEKDEDVTDREEKTNVIRLKGVGNPSWVSKKGEPLKGTGLVERTPVPGPEYEGT